MKTYLESAMVGLWLAQIFSVVSATSLSLWPEPGSVSSGDVVVGLSADFCFTIDGTASTSSILSRAVKRYEALIGTSSASASGLSTCTLYVATVEKDEQAERASLWHDVDESYQVYVGDDESTCEITSKTVFGALRGLETFSQLLRRSEDGAQLESAPILIDDAPAYGHRGMMIDTARHFLPMEMLKHIVDTVAMNKMNVLHWHAVDAESFPLVTPSSPQLSQGAYSAAATYTPEQVAALSKYAADRGVKLLVEVDWPGHAASVTKGYPEIMARCFRKYSYNFNDFALNPTKDKTYDVVFGAYDDVIAGNAGATRLHMGGDEVVYGCWDDDASIVAYKNAHGIASNDELYGMFITRTGKHVAEHGIAPILWQEAFLAWDRCTDAQKENFVFAEGTTFQVWSGDGSIISDITARNFSAIASPNAYWYMDYATSTWDVMYYYDPKAGLSAEQQALLVGGEAVAFAEKIDDNNFDSITQPRAAAVAERLWSDRAALPDDPASKSARGRADRGGGGGGGDDTTDKDAVQRRLMDHRCRMKARGVRAAPIAPDFCATLFV